MVSAREPIYIFGGGAIGLALAFHLGLDGRNPVVIRTTMNILGDESQKVSVSSGGRTASPVAIHMQPLAEVRDITGLLLVTAKAFANPGLAEEFGAKNIRGPIVLLQNGLGVEKPFLASRSGEVYRGVIYATAQKQGKNQVSFRAIQRSPIGSIWGPSEHLHRIVDRLDTPGFRFYPESAIQVQIWKKAVINSVFNSICPLLEVDNGIFVRDGTVAHLAQAVVGECLQVAQASGIDLEVEDIMTQLLQISEGSTGQLISTLQDIQNGRETEIDALNLEIARIAELLTPPLEVPLTKMLGLMTQVKARLHQEPPAITPDL